MQERIESFLRRIYAVAKSWVGGLLLLGLLAPAVTLSFGSALGFFVSFGVLALLILHFTGITLNLLSINNIDTPADPAPPPQPKPLPKSQSQNTSNPLSLGNAQMSADLSRSLTVTVVVPMYNEERFISECLESLLQQTWRHWECIVVDDASTDASYKIAAKYAAQDKRIKIVRHHRNSGLSASRNTGLRHTSTEWVTFLDADDMLLRNGLLMRVNHFSTFRDDPFLAGVYSGIVQVPESTTHKFAPPNQNFERTVKDFVNCQSECPFNAHAPLVRTELLRSIGGFDESMLHGAEDWDLWQRVMRHGFYFRSVPKIGGLYRQKKQSMVRTLAVEHIYEAKKLYAKAQDKFNAQVNFGIRPLLEPAAEYANVLSFARRVIPFAAMACLNGGREGVNRVLETLPSSAGSYLLRHLNVEQLALTGIKRALAQSASSSASADHEVKLIVSSVVDAFSEFLAERDESILNELSILPEKYDVIIYATDAYEVGLAAEILRTRSGALLIPETVNGTQGAIDQAAEQQLPWLSINRFCFSNFTVGEVIVFKTHGFGIESLQQVAREKGVALVYQQPAIRIEPKEGTLPEVELLHVDGKTQIDLSGSDGAMKQPFRYPLTILNLEENPLETPDVDKLAGLYNKHLGERCVIVGNGPSLNAMDLTLLADEVSFAVNGIFYKTKEMGFAPTYFVVEDNSVMEENQEEIRAFDAPHKLFPSIYRKFHPVQDNTYFFRLNRGFYEKTSSNYCIPRFSTDITQRLYCGQSVTFINLQLAYYMGFSEVYLIGMDFSYTIPDSAIRNGDLIVSTEDDPNHFNGQYFGKGKTWKDPKLDRVLQNYYMAKRMYEADGRRIYNATVGGALEAFERVDYHELFSGEKASQKLA